MTSWLIRGVLMSIVQIAARFILGAVVIAAPLSKTLSTSLALAAVVLIAIVWGGIDGIRDARAHADPDDYDDLTVRWLKAGLLAGFVSCLVSWIVGTAGWFNGIGQASFAVEIFAGTSFITLIVFVPAFFGASIGRLIIRREQRKAERNADAPTEQTPVAA
ncbi:B-4DMT family transporter [Gordonia sp. HY285]|uniref:B-4DMT family transporter n=1 Tax=Gordonia liuliyuniae TaxID=2911517 RepID=A0ABS9IR51_9ACTN|nr:B-4DMT family transporter [Gordonia liuliyuniae]MCF8588011.1 B-4DMT family transporter [Gordonia liuliyuniae]MCF8610707.1 B-4DMT family transporter [Gordonia liuliyuniae]